jgi:phage baseplate assembly protein V
MIATVLKLIEPLRRRMALMVARGVVSVVNDSLKLQNVQVKLLSGEVRDYERIQQYGFTSVPLETAEAVAVCIDGDRDHGIVIAVDDKRYRIKGLQGGEVALYTDEGDKIHLKRGHKIEMIAGTALVPGEITIKAEGTPMGAVRLGGLPIETAVGVVTGACACSITGAPHAVTSLSVKATL